MLLFKVISPLALLFCSALAAPIIPDAPCGSCALKYRALALASDGVAVDSAAALQDALAKKAPRILLKSGVSYEGQFVIEHPCSLLGPTSGPFPILTNAAFTKQHNVESATLHLKAKGVVRIERVDVYNTAEDYNKGQPVRGKQPRTPTLAVAVSQSTQAVLIDVHQKSWQDTFLCSGQCFVKRGSIAGWVDMLYGAFSSACLELPIVMPPSDAVTLLVCVR